MQKWVVVCWALLALVGADECPDGARCEDGQTCCNDPDNGYECCPFDQAECCGDHMHCCPGGTTCDTATSSCVNATVSIPWVERASAAQPRLSKSFRMIKTYMGEEDDNICPDQSRCPPEFSCLRALTRFGCCPIAQGVPCSDGKHCCPEGHQCSSDSRSCIKKELVTTVLCSDGVSECPDETTCCQTEDGKWGCCPMPKAVCCDDKIHCCPEGTTCDVAHNKCISSSTKKEMPMWAKFPARLRAEWENQKVLLSEGEQVTAETVDDGGSKKVPEVTPASAVPPSGKEVSVSPDTKAAAGNDVPCNTTAACPDGTTCCKTQEGGWACCPLVEAVCCEDFIHCCPKGTTCNLTAQTCDGDTWSVSWVKKVPTVPRQGVQVRDVTCDSASSCPDGTTCCKTQEGGWACCPLVEAVCCEDFIHCCPKGTTCNLTAQTCDGDTWSVSWVKKVPTVPRQGVQVRDVTCDSASSCPDGTTCCKTQEGGWACCPLVEAVCCEDFIHCCPKGTTCNLTAQTCDGDTWSVSWVKKVPTVPRQGVQVRDVTCDSTSSCPDGTTCCKTTKGGWGCCPLPGAVCCADGNHCCPTNYKCDEQQTSCIKEEVVIPWYTKLPATSIQADPSSVQCDGLSQCPEHTSCCKLLSGKWGCCPLENAVCCPDMEHCCPHGYTCNVASNSCQKLILLQLETVPLSPVYLPEHQPQLSPLKHRDVQCDDTISCQDGQTCCRMSITTWGCCPLPNAVCCSDMLHCCPNGHTCTDTGDCSQDTRLHWNNWNVFLANKKRALIV